MSIAVFERTSVHSHIKGLGIREGKPLKIGDGLVGQEEARKAAWIVVQMIKQGRMAGRGVLLVGPPGTGKTALAIAIAKELGEDTPFVSLSGSEIYSAEMKKTEALTRAMRRAIGVRVHEFRRIMEGVVRKIDVKLGPHPYNPYQQIPVGGTITLVTKDDEKTLRVSGDFVQELLAKGVSEGDVIMIDLETYRVYRQGRAKGSGDYDIYGTRTVEVPSGSIEKEREFVYTVTLHDLDMMHSRAGSILSLFFGAEEKEISPEVRQRVDETVKSWVDGGKAELLPGVLFIDDVHMLDIEAFSFLSRAMESELAPIIILASNRGFTKIRGTDIVSPHGLPRDLLDRLLIIKTRLHTRDEIKEILKIRAKEDKIELSEDALEKLADYGVKESLRYAAQLMIPAKIIAQRENKSEVDAKAVEEAAKLFLSMSGSAKYLREMEEAFLK